MLPSRLLPDASQGLGERFATRLLLFPPRLIQNPTFGDAEGSHSATSGIHDRGK